MEIAPAARDRSVEAALDEWRRGAVDLCTIILLVVFAPGLVLVLSGQIPPVTPLMVALAVGFYLSIAAAAVLRRAGHRTRVWLVLGSGYLLALTGMIGAPHAPVPRALPVALPIFALVLVGTRAGRFAALTSILVIVLVPFLRASPAVVRAFQRGPYQALEPPGVLVLQVCTMAGLLLGLLFMLELFHGFLLRTLVTQRQATAQMEQEALERAAAHQRLTAEIDERRRLEQEIARIGDEERRRLGQDVHDGVCQQLTGALLRCQALERQIQRGGAPNPDELRALASLLEEAIDEAHDVAKGLSPLEPDPEALAVALRLLVRRTQQASGTHCEFSAAGDVRVAVPLAAQHLYRIAQEAINNAVRHSQAERIAVELCGSDDELLLAVQDDGIGLPEEIPGQGMGLRTMAYRARMMDGELTLGPAPGGGTRIACRVPNVACRCEESPPGVAEEGEKR